MVDESEKKKSLKERLYENQLGLRLLVAIFFTLCLAAFLHFREVRVDVLELNATAGKYVVSQIDFEFIDPEATIIMKQEAIRDIGKIYQIDPKQIRQIRFEFENSLVQEDRTGGVNYKDSYTAADIFEEVLLNARFTDSKTIQQMDQLEFSTEDFQVFTPSSTAAPIVLPRQYWKRFSQDVSKMDRVNPRALDSVLRFFQGKKWSFSPDNDRYSKVTKKAQNQVPDKLTAVKAGTRVIDQGEKVSSRHILMMSAMKSALGENKKLWEPLTILSSLIMALIFVILSGWYFAFNQAEIITSLQKLSLLVTIVLLTMVFAKVTEFVLINNTSSYLDIIRYPLLIPFATILICALLDARIGLYTAAFLAIILAVTLAVDHSRFLVINLVSSLVVIISTRGMRKRKEVFAICGKAFLSVVPIFFAFSFSGNQIWSLSLIADFASAGFFLLLTAILIVGLLPLLESLFRIMTDMSLMEYMDPNNELLRRLVLEAPGTYQHSLVLGNIAEACARSIKANGLFCRVATLYHDIGKLNNPHFFTENQQGGVNIHQLLTPIESTKVIISHVTDGEMLARKYRLPKSFIDVIKEHHGTTLVYYFYSKELELKGGDAKLVDETIFRYPGPKPHSKESAIIMIADTVEAASRSLDEVTEESLTALVDRLIGNKAEDGQFDECRLTFEELGIVKNTLVKNLMITNHVRIKYPTPKKS